MPTATLHKAVCADVEITVTAATTKGDVKAIGTGTIGIAQRTCNSGSKCVFATKAGPVWKHTISGTTGATGAVGDFAYVYSATGNVTASATGTNKIGTFHTAPTPSALLVQVQYGV